MCDITALQDKYIKNIPSFKKLIGEFNKRHSVVRNSIFFRVLVMSKAFFIFFFVSFKSNLMADYSSCNCKRGNIIPKGLYGYRVGIYIVSLCT